jgi:hypothetical protein
LFSESHKNEAVPFAEPESYIFKPPNLSDGSLTFTEINEVSTFNCDDVTYTIEAEPKTVKS